MEKKIIYAKTLNPEYFDYRVYDIREDDGNEVIIDGGREFSDVDQKGYLASIKEVISGYNSWDYEYCYHNSIMDFLKNNLSKKANGKALSPKQANEIKTLLETYCEKLGWDNKHNLIKCLLSIIACKPYKHISLYGSCQGDYVDAYCPCETSQSYIDFIEAWFFGTGTEILVYDGDLEPETADDIEEGFTFYTANWKDEDIKNEIKEYCGYKAEDESVEVKLWLYNKTRTIYIDEYKLAD